MPECSPSEVGDPGVDLSMPCGADNRRHSTSGCPRLPSFVEQRRSRSPLRCDDRVARILAPSRVAVKQAPVNQVFQVALGGGHGALRECRPFPRGQFALELTEEAIQNYSLPLVERRERMALPDIGLAQDASAGLLPTFPLDSLQTDTCKRGATIRRI